MKTVKLKLTYTRITTLLEIMKHIHCPSIEDTYAAIMANEILKKLFKRIRNRAEDMPHNNIITLGLSDGEAAALQAGLLTVPNDVLGVYEESIIRSTINDISQKILWIK